MADDKTFFAVVALPFALWALQKACDGLFTFRQTLRARLLDTTQLRDDIRTNLKTTLEQAGRLREELDGMPSKLESKLLSDEQYYIFSVSSEVTVQVFESGAVQRYSHLDSDLFNAVKQFYDLQKIITATFDAAMSDNFKKLSVPRKLGTIVQLLGHLENSNQIGDDCLPDLDREITLIHQSWLWKILFLTHENARSAKVRSEGEGT